MFSVNKTIPKQFLEFQFFCSLFWKKNGKKQVFVIFSKMVALTELERIWFETSDRDIYIVFQVSDYDIDGQTPARGASDSAGRRKDRAKPNHS